MIVAEEVSHPMQSPPGSTDYPASINPTVIQRVFDDLAAVATGKLISAGATAESLSIARSVEMRFRSQIHVLTVNVLEAKIGPDAIFALVDRFIDQYEARFGKGSALADTGIEITTFRIVATSAVQRSELGMLVKRSDGTKIESRGTRQVFAGGQHREAKIFDADDLYVGAEIDGLAIVETRDTTIVIGAGQSAVVDEVGSVIIEHKVLGATAFGRLQDERSE
jgi:N-methylhydantoinase A